MMNLTSDRQKIDTKKLLSGDLEIVRGRLDSNYQAVGPTRNGKIVLASRGDSSTYSYEHLRPDDA